MKREAQVGLASRKMAEDVGEPDVKIAIVARDCGVGKFLLEFGDEALGVTELDGADALVGGGEENRAEAAVADGVTDGESFAAIAVVERSHTELRRRFFVNAAGGRVSGSVQRVSHIGAILQLALEGFEAQRIGIFARRYAEQLLKTAQQMGRAERDGAGQITQGRRLFGGFDLPAGCDDFGGCGIGFVRLRTAALARTESGALGGVGIGKKLDAVTLGTATRTRWTAINAGRTDGIDESTVET